MRQPKESPDTENPQQDILPTTEGTDVSKADTSALPPQPSTQTEEKPVEGGELQDNMTKEKPPSPDSAKSDSESDGNEASKTSASSQNDSEDDPERRAPRQSTSKEIGEELSYMKLTEQVEAKESDDESSSSSSSSSDGSDDDAEVKPGKMRKLKRKPSDVKIETGTVRLYASLRKGVKDLFEEPDTTGTTTGTQ